MNTPNTHYKKKPGSGKKWAGLILLLLGVILLIKTLGGYIPDWITSWPMILIIIGIFTGLRDNFRKPGALVLIFIGTVFLAGRIIPGIDLHDFIFPVLIIGLGLYLILGRRRTNRPDFQKDYTKDYTWDKRIKTEEQDPSVGSNPGVAASAGPETPLPELPPVTSSPFGNEGNNTYMPGDDYLDTVSVFGSIKKNIVSKNFRGGEIVTIMGGAEINLSQADIHGTVVVEVTQIFGGTKLIVPPQWKVTSDLAALFGGIEDKRQLIQVANLAEDKVLVIRGTSVFGGIDIRSF